MKKSSYEAGELLDFLAELALEKGSSVSYLSFGNNIALVVATDGEDIKNELFVPLKPGEIAAEVPKLKFLEDRCHIKIPVLREAEQEALLEALRGIKQRHLRIYRLSLYERYSFYSRKFAAKNGFFRTASAESSLQM